MVENQQSLARKPKIELSVIQLNCSHVYSRMSQNQNTISISAYPCLLELCSQETNYHQSGCHQQIRYSGYRICGIQTMKSYSAIRRVKLCPLSGSGCRLEIILRCEISHLKRDEDCIFSHVDMQIFKRHGSRRETVWEEKGHQGEGIRKEWG